MLSTLSVYDSVIQSKCPSKDVCQGPGITSFQPNYAYTYDYEVETVSEMRGSSDNQSRMKIKARALIFARSSCSFVLKVHIITELNILFWVNVHDLIFKLENVKIEGSEASKSFADALTAHSVQFGLEDRIISDVCSHPNEPEWVLNIKKGLISSFQSSVSPSQLGTNITEVDSSTHFPTFPML